MEQIEELDVDEIINQGLDVDEIISFFAKRGYSHVVRILRDAVNQYKRDMVDDDYVQELLSESSDDCDIDCVLEKLTVSVNPDGFFELK